MLMCIIGIVSGPIGHYHLNLKKNKTENSIILSQIIVKNQQGKWDLTFL